MGRIGTGFLVAVALSLAFLSQPAAAQSAAERCEKLSGGLDAAIAACDEALRLNPKDAAAYYHRGLTWYFKRDYDLAIADYNRAIELDPKDAKAYYPRGRAWLMKGDTDRSIADYNRAIELDPMGNKTSPVTSVRLIHEQFQLAVHLVRLDLWLLQRKSLRNGHLLEQREREDL